MTCNIVQVVTFALVVSSAFALTCYKCDSSQSKLCNYGISSMTYSSVDCNEEVGGTFVTNWYPKQCVKLVAKGKDGTEYVARGCMPHSGGACTTIAKTLSFFSTLGDSDIEDMQCYPCDGDKCNSATTFTRYTLLGVIMAAFLFML